MKYTQREWDRIVGWGAVPESYKKKGFVCTVTWIFNPSDIPEGVVSKQDMKRYMVEYMERCLRIEEECALYEIDIEEKTYE